MATKKRKGPVKLIHEGEPCGCTFRYATGFSWRCEFHKTMLLEIRAQRIASNGIPNNLRPEPLKPRPRKKRKHDSPELVQSIRAEIARRTEILRIERAKIKRSTGKLRSAERAHLHTFAFTSEQVRQELAAQA